MTKAFHTAERPHSSPLAPAGRGAGGEGAGAEAGETPALPPTSKQKGFTLVELLIVIAVIALLMSLAAPRYWGGVDRTREAVLRENLSVIRNQLDRFYTDRGRYPDTLDQLVEYRYLRQVPVDPITERSDSWILVPPPRADMGRISDVHSGAPGKADDETPYRDL